jgi:hypothetical protein
MKKRYFTLAYYVMSALVFLICSCPAPWGGGGGGG